MKTRTTQYSRHHLFECGAILLWLIWGSPSLINAQGQSLEALLAQARDGDTIRIPPGVYNGDLRLQKRVALIGVDHPIIRGSGAGSVITVEADGCTIRGLILERSGRDVMREDAGILVKSSHNEISGNHLRDVLFGIYLLNAGGNVVYDNVIEGRGELEFGQRGSGIHVWNSDSNVFVRNRITDARDGFYIQNARHTLVEANEVSRVRYGLHYMYADSNVFVANRFEQNLAGAAVMYSRAITLRHNLFLQNRSTTSYGILFQDCHGVVADSNVIADNAVGLFFEASTGNTFRHNLILRNDVALQMFQNATGNTFVENNFMDNLTLLTIVGKRTETHWSSGGRGNYWSTYDGYDVDVDEIGDVPMVIQNAFDFLEGRQPTVRLYLYSPASQALAAAARAFPILRIHEEQDPHPLMRPVKLGEMPALREQGRTAPERQTQWALMPLGGFGAMLLLYVNLARRRR